MNEHEITLLLAEVEDRENQYPEFEREYLLPSADDSLYFETLLAS